MKEIKDQVLSIIKDIENGYRAEYSDGNYEEGEIVSAFDYLEGVLDINYILDSNREYKGARILVAFGGPNIWIDTDKQVVEGYWWGDSFTASYHDDVMGINEALEEIWRC